MVTIHAENPCVGTVEFRDGLPKSHRDPNYHGFGMRSMERIAEKYGGLPWSPSRSAMSFVWTSFFFHESLRKRPLSVTGQRSFLQFSM